MKYRIDGLFNHSEMETSDGPTWNVTTQEPRTKVGSTEHQRLKDAVVDAVRKEDRKGMLTPWIESAREALIEFEKRQHARVQDREALKR